jgi:putative endonuclease
MVPAISIEKHFSELKNILKNQNLRRGLACELEVSRFFEKSGYKLLAHRLKTPFGEIDLVMISPEKTLKLLEVKSARNEEFISNRVGRIQKQRLSRIHAYFLARYSDVELNLAMVNGQNKVQVFDEI